MWSKESSAAKARPTLDDGLGLTARPTLADGLGEAEAEGREGSVLVATTDEGEAEEGGGRALHRALTGDRLTAAAICW